MEQISKAESIKLFEDFSKSKFSSIKFSNEGSIYKFTPSYLGIFFYYILYTVIFITPHLIYFFGVFSKNQLWNNLLYLTFSIGSMLVIYLLVTFISTYEIVINKLINEVVLTPKDILGKYLKKIIQIKIDNISEIKEIHFKTKSGGEAYLILLTKDGIKHRLFALSSWDNVTKLKTAFSVLVFDKVHSFDDSKEPSVIIDKLIEKHLKDKDSETSYLPIIVFFSTILIIILGLVVFYGFGKINSYCAQIDSLSFLIFKLWGIIMALYAIPIYFASHTAYQVKQKATRKTIVVFGLMAMLGSYLCCSGLINYLNIKLDRSQPFHTQANVVDSYYSIGSKSTSSSYVIVLQIKNVSDKILVKHHDPHLHVNLKSTLSISIFDGYFKKRWLKID